MMGKRAVFVAAAAALVLAAVIPVSAAGRNTATVTVKNETGYYLVEVNRSAEDEAEWSESVLGEDVAIRPYKERVIELPAGYSSVRALFDVDGTEVEVVEAADFEGGGEYVWTITEEMVMENYGAYYGDDGGYYDGSYGYYDYDYGYYDYGYGYYDDTYGYYGGY
jgi:hypothetical protein